MIFSSIVFVFLFFPVVLSIYLLIRSEIRIIFLLVSSLVFYFWGEGQYIYVIITYTITNFAFALIINKLKKHSSYGAKIALFFSVVFNLGLLVFYKYFVFMIGNLNFLLNYAEITLESPNIHVPLGISFFSFQAMSYVMDVYRGDVDPAKNILAFSMYFTFFPKLIAGPIVRYKDVAQQLINGIFSTDKIVEGIGRFILGLGKKVLIADNLARVVEPIFSLTISEIHFGTAWVGIISFSLQIYFDFSGYSDMAIGLGKIFGLDFLENFNFPYISKSIIQFWRRWHISLSTWFKDYLFRPMAGGMVTSFKQYAILTVIVFFLCGLWHGAAWTFIIWGLWHGFFIIAERTLVFGTFIKTVPKFFRHLYTLLVIIVGWVFFKADGLSFALGYLKKMFFELPEIHSTLTYINYKFLLILLLGIVGSTPLLKNIFKKINQKSKNSPTPNSLFTTGVRLVTVTYLIIIFCTSILSLSASTYNPFIYFKF